MRILGIETSCDETAAAVVEDGMHVRSNVIASAKDAFLWSGGVIPEEAARKQVECILPVITQALAQADILPECLDAIAVTRGPGLLGSLIVGTTTARVLSAIWQKPLIPVHHHLGHLSSIWLNTADEPQFPLLTLTVSGGHTELWLRTTHTSGELLGQTRDDAAGEAFDKGACLLGLPYPGGPAIAKAAENGNPNAFPFPNPLHNEDTLDFSFSGIKTALKYLLRDMGYLSDQPYTIPSPSGGGLGRGGQRNSSTPSPVSSPQGRGNPLANLAASYQHAICRHLCDHTVKALARYPQVKEVHLVGGVSANAYLRTMLEKTVNEERGTSQRVTIRWPQDSGYCTDNAAMIAAAAEFLIAERGWPPALFTTDASPPTMNPWSSHSLGTSSSSSFSHSSPRTASSSVDMRR